jgi:hypothetical protein
MSVWNVNLVSTMPIMLGMAQAHRQRFAAGFKTPTGQSVNSRIHRRCASFASAGWGIRIPLPGKSHI